MRDRTEYAGVDTRNRSRQTTQKWIDDTGGTTGTVVVISPEGNEIREEVGSEHRMQITDYRLHITDDIEQEGSKVPHSIFYH
jgi:hypothetical protein